MRSLYRFTEYSPEWPVQFSQEAAQLRSLLGDEIITIHHIGSTSVPGLAAKPIIDLLPVVSSVQQIDRATPTLQAAGYRAWGEYGLPGRRFFTKDRDGYRTHNIHMYQDDDPDVERHLAFCTYLRNHDDIRDEYAALKHRIYQRHPSDIDAYSEGKNEWIKHTEAIALDWYRRHRS